MSNLDRVRADIKSWERDFASRHGRDPSVQDIRELPFIAEKYKLYKKLSKTLPRSRPADTVPPLARSNPFSPVKKSPTSRSTNPFATPTKNKSKSHPRPPSSSPDPSHPVPNPSSSHGPKIALSRARKRLRGDPVSPSPSKPKRQRIQPKLDQDSSNSDYEELPQRDFTSSFVADSPVKAPAGGKSFKLLFDDALPALSIAKKSLGSVSQLVSPPDTSLPRASTDPPDSTLKFHHDPSNISGPEHRINLIQTKIFPTKDHPSTSSHKPNFPTTVSRVSQPRTSTKRSLETGDLAHELTECDTPSQSKYTLIPPSPPPQDSDHRGSGKGKAKTLPSRKKLRLDDEQSDGVDSPDDITLKVATVSLHQGKRSHRPADDLDWDPLLHLGTRNHDPAKRQIDANHHASGTFSVDLPDKFRRVLAISPSRSQNSTEERVVRGLLYGDRIGHYDPSRGGDIWGVGETDDATYGDIETEDDWEGEPIPWEVGEL